MADPIRPSTSLMSATFIIGDRVRLRSAPPYLKTADTMPMLRPGDLVAVGSEGIIQAQKSGGYWTVKFDQGAFLVDSEHLERVIYGAEAEKTSP